MSDLDFLKDVDSCFPFDFLNEDLKNLSNDIAEIFLKEILSDNFNDSEPFLNDELNTVSDIPKSINDPNESSTSDIIDDILLMDNHVNEDTIIKENNDEPVLKIVNVFDICTCPLCKKDFVSKDWLEIHMKTHLEYRPLKPRLVVQTDYASLIYDDSKYQAELNNQILDTVSKPYVCCNCQMRFETTELLEAHKGQHVKVNAFECKECGVSFKVAWQLSTHLFGHTKSVYVCNQCHKKFKTAEILKEHLKEHETDVFICEKCGIIFNNIIKLKDHLKDHNMVYKCHICSQIFTTIYNLNEHIINHSKKEVYKCTKCTKRFINSEKLKLHIQFHDEKKGVFCHICQKRFNTLSLLKRHVKVHDVQVENRCEICGKTFSRINNLTQHLRAHARKEKYLLINL